MTESIRVPAAGRLKKLVLAAIAYLLLWLLTGWLGAPQVRKHMQGWQASGASGVAGDLTFAAVTAWSPCPFLVAAEKHNVGFVVDLQNGSSRTARTDTRWFLWLLFPIEL